MSSCFKHIFLDQCLNISGIFNQALSVLDAFNKDRASMPQPLQAPPALAPLPFPPDARTQEMIKEKLQKAEELG